MIVATEVVMRYRQALNYLWNVHFYGQPEFRSYEHLAAEQFVKCQLPLFISLVMDRLEGFDFEDPTSVFGEDFKIVPAVGGNFGSPLTVTRKTGGGFIDHIKGHFTAEDLKLCVIDFFDFQVRGWRDFRYYRAQIEAFPLNPHLVGCEALIDVSFVDVVWAPKHLASSPNSETLVAS